MKSLTPLTANLLSLFQQQENHKPMTKKRVRSFRLTSFRSFYFFLFTVVFFTSCQKEIHFDETPAARIMLVNPGFEQDLTGWTIETDYQGQYGFTSSKDAIRTGNFGLNFYAAQTHHFPMAPQETPWNGVIYQIVSGLADGIYEFKAYADAVGEGMYLWASSGGEDFKVPIKSATNELNVLEFSVKGGEAKVGFICIDADGEAKFAPYFHADDVELWKK